MLGPIIATYATPDTICRICAINPHCDRSDELFRPVIAPVVLICVSKSCAEAQLFVFHLFDC